MTRWKEHAFEQGSMALGVCAVCDNYETRPWHLTPLWQMRTAEGLVTANPVVHLESVCEGQRAERAMYFEGAWHWFCLTCGAFWVVFAVRWMRDLWKEEA